MRTRPSSFTRKCQRSRASGISSKEVSVKGRVYFSDATKEELRGPGGPTRWAGFI